MSNGIERRDFLKVIGVGGVGAGLTGCGTGGAERLIPYVVPHEEIVPGIATWYRTTCRECPAGCGMNIRTREGRAVKAEGNPLSPIAHGRLCSRGQASLHGLYDPDRIPRPLARAGNDDWDRLTWDEAERQLAGALQQHRGRTVLLTGNYTGSMDVLADQFAAAVGAQRVRWEPFAYEPLRAASRMVYGVDAVPVHDFANADVVITFGADFMETWLSPVDYMHDFTAAHAYSQGRRGKLISVGPHQSLTGLNADEWVLARPGTEHLVALAIARVLADEGRASGPGVAALGETAEALAERAGVNIERIRQIAHDFAQNGRSLAVGPGIAAQHSAATAVAAAVAVLNQVAGNVGRTVRLERREEFATRSGTYADMQALVALMSAGQVGALLVHGPNPLYSMPEHEAVAEGLRNVPFIASFSSMLDETSAHAHLLLPDHHFLESWGDYVPRTGLTTLVQPVMVPVFDTKQTADVLLSVARRIGATLPTQANTYYDYLRERWARTVLPGAGVAGTFDNAWREALQVGFVQGGATGAAADAAAAAAGVAAVTTPPPGAQTAPPAAQAAPPGPQAAPPPATPAPVTGSTQVAQPQGLGALSRTEATFSGEAGDDAYYLIVYPSMRFWDGRLANRLWLQELPDPVSKFCWSSWVEINPATADRLRLDNGHIVEVTTPRGSVELPVWRHPGVRTDTIAIQMGQGHDGLGRYAKDRGANPVRLLEAMAEPQSGALVYAQTRATLRHTGRWERPIQAGLHHDQDNRDIARAYTLPDARHRDELRHQPLLPIGAVAGGMPAHAAEADAQAVAHGGRAPGVHPEPDVHPLDAEVHNLQASGGWAPAAIDASPQGFPQPGTHYGEYSEEQPRWGMVIDLDRCTGCSACITACYAENNIGIVGPEQVQKGRILHWIRLERYFEGEGEETETRFLPMLCQHCGTAPCEPVCPVYAAYHTPEGLNAQIYNRCVGTRYCANNCPYKVRVFNWFTHEWPEPLNWQLNPDVTVREKGVMEKCTMCVQRIRDAQNTARLQNRGPTDGEITPACAQTCPADVIVFGNMKDPNSRVRRMAESGRAYRVLESINTQSAIVYLRKISAHAPPADAGAH